MADIRVPIERPDIGVQTLFVDIADGELSIFNGTDTVHFEGTTRAVGNLALAIERERKHSIARLEEKSLAMVEALGGTSES